jgi:hypothetical protein
VSIDSLPMPPTPVTIAPMGSPFLRFTTNPRKGETSTPSMRVMPSMPP